MALGHFQCYRVCQKMFDNADYEFNQDIGLCGTPQVLPT